MVYLLKINVAIALFYAFYRLFFYKDTFFAWRRTALLCFFAVSAAVPLLNIQTWVTQQEPMVAMADLYASVVLPEITLHTQAETDWKQLVVKGISIAYWAGVVLLSIRFLMQLTGIIRLARRCPIQKIDESTIHLLPRAEGPFSFFHWIFVCPDAHTDEELKEILTHERTHARQWHSIDVLTGELVCIICWFNPFAWLMKREIRTNLEYMADEKVLETGHDSRAYQYHLLGLSHHKAAATIYNSFNVLPLKKRITMMNKRRTRKIGRTKYLMFLPLAALLMIVSNIEAVARATQKVANEVLETAGTTTVQPQPESTISQPQQEKAGKIIYKGKIVDEAGNALGDVQIVTDQQFKSTTVSTVNTKGEFRVETSSQAGIVFMHKGKDGRTLGWAGTAKDLAKMDPNNMVIVMKPQTVVKTDEDVVFEVVEKMPEYPDGGQAGLMNYLKENIKYPEAAKKAGVQGRVILQFVVDKDGSIDNVSVLRGVNPDLDKEAIRVVSNMPKWKPGMQRGEAVKVKYTVPIAFSLPSESIDKIDEMVAVGYEQPASHPEDNTYAKVEQMPQYPGGLKALMQYLAKNVKYPTDAQKKGIQGQVLVQIIVGEDGKVTDAQIMKSVSPSLDAEALRVAYNMPQWKPGTIDGKPVKVKYAFPINFRLSK